MVVFFVRRASRGPLTSFLSTWAARLDTRVVLEYYEDLLEAATISGAATYVFADLESLRPAPLERAGALADELAGTGAVILNHPRRALRRFALLQMLYDRGINRFRAYRALEMDVEPRFPVFLRRDDKHNGPVSGLLWSQRELDEAIASRVRAGRDLGGLLVVEFENTADASGLYHRQVTYVVGSELFHGNLAFDTNWVVKYGGGVEGDQLESQRFARASTEHLSLLRDIADRAGIQYGRFDFSFAGKGISIWELNTNPTLLLAAGEYPPEVRAERQELADRITDALERLATGMDSAPLAWPDQAVAQ